jgi:hypothetical protein
VKTFSEWLKANGYDEPQLTEQMRKHLEAAYKAETAPPPPPPEPPKPKQPGMDEVIAAARAEEERKTRITEIVARVITDRPDMIATAEALGRQAIEAKWDTDRFELEVLRAQRSSGGVHLHIPRGEAAVTEEVVECAVAMAGSLTNVGKHYKAETIEAARKKWRNGLSMGEMAVTAAHRQGFRGHTLRANLREVLRAAMAPPDLRAGVAGPSTYSVPNILSNVANKFALEGFYAVDGAWREISSRRSVSDFKQTTSLRATADLQYKKLAPGGEIQHGEIGERAYTNQAYTYARMIGISREDWINDDTGALAGMSREMGIGAGDAINNVFWTVFLNNSAFFAAGNNNVSTGVPSLTSLAAADSVFRLQTKPNGRPLGLEPAILLVPTALRITAMGLMTDTMVGTTTANTLMPAQNILAGAYRVVSSPYMSNSAFTGYSAVAWYLLANPSQLSTIEGVFLNGQETPTVEQADFDWNTLGTSMRGYIDFGFAQQEFRAGVRSTGA